MDRTRGMEGFRNRVCESRPMRPKQRKEIPLRGQDDAHFPERVADRRFAGGPGSSR